MASRKSKLVLICPCRCSRSGDRSIGSANTQLKSLCMVCKYKAVFLGFFQYQLPLTALLSLPTSLRTRTGPSVKSLSCQKDISSWKGTGSPVAIIGVASFAGVGGCPGADVYHAPCHCFAVSEAAFAG
eukprot:4225899-Amphidinium_carterae.2